jgi:hypothetical protein
MIAHKLISVSDIILRSLLRNLNSIFSFKILVLKIIFGYYIIDNMDPNNPDTNANANTDMNNNKPMMGGRRKGNKTRKEPNVLKSWRKFVRKVQHEEHLTYPKAMKRASQRKSEWQRGGATDGADNSMGADSMASKMEPSMGPSMAPKMSMPGMAPKMGGRRRRRSRKQRGGDEGEEEESMGASMEDEPQEEESMGASMGGRRKRSRRQRGGNASSSVSDFDGNYKQYGKVGGSRKRRSRR